jgi:hypothetical protein
LWERRATFNGRIDFISARVLYMWANIHWNVAMGSAEYMK